MALSFTNLLADGSGSATSYTTASVTPNSNRLLLLGINAGTASSTQPLAPDVSGCGLTWEHIATVDYDTSGTSDRQSCFLYRAMGASPSTGGITIDFASTGEALGRGCSWTLDESSSDVDTSGTNGSGAIVQSATALGSSSSTSLTVTLNAFGDATNNVAFGYFAKQNNTAYTAGSGFTLLGEPTTPSNRRAMSEYQLGEDTSVDCSWTTGIRCGGIAVEVKAATGGGGTTHQITASGSGATGGSASIGLILPIAATGTGTTDGSAAITLLSGPVTHQLTATGSGTSGGTAAISATIRLGATGTGSSGGNAALSAILRVSAAGSGTTGGTAAITLVPGGVVHQITAVGSSESGGSVTTTMFHVFRHLFSPPLHEEPIRTERAPIKYFRLTHAPTVLRRNGTFIAMRTPPAEWLVGEDGKDYFIGGHEYEVSEATKAELQAAGFTVTSI